VWKHPSIKGSNPANNVFLHADSIESARSKVDAHIKELLAKNGLLEVGYDMSVYPSSQEEVETYKATKQAGYSTNRMMN